jgi:hypothetical protein
MKKFVIFLYIFIFHTIAFAQEEYYTYPVKIPVLLSGSFAELRDNHFHSGIDIKTQRVTGIPVYSVANGYISRIAVSPSGYGNVIYIDHTNGTTSVYGHLGRFRKDIQEYIKGLQYQRRSFRVDIQVPYNKFPVNRDDLIGYSGNTGSSGGPHLHFEIRDSYTQEPLNPLNQYFKVEDNIPPSVYSLMITPLDKNSHVEFNCRKKIYPAIYSGSIYRPENQVIPVFGNIGFAVQTNDFFDGSENKCGVYSIEMTVDDQLYYSFSMDRFSFNETRYLNSHIDYAEYISNQRRFHKTWLDPGNRLGIYTYIHKNGIYNLNDGKKHDIRIDISDINGNKSVIRFSVQSIYDQVSRDEEKFTKFLKYDQNNNFYDDSIIIDFPKGSLYNNLYFNYRKNSFSSEYLSPVHIVHSNTVPLHKRVMLAIQARDFDKSLYRKALLVDVDTISGDISSVGGTYKNGWVWTHIRTFGNFAVALDTVPPVIAPLSINSNSELTESARICFRIKDGLSGINTIEGILDGKWALFEYDAKNNLISHYFDYERFEMNKMHHLKLTVSDFKGNKSVYEASFRK